MSPRAIDRECFVRESIAGYQPTAISESRWEEIKADVEEIVTDVVVHRLGGFSEQSTRRELRELALRMGYFLAFCLDTFGELYADRYTYFENDTIALFSHFMKTKFAKSYAERTVYCVREVAVWRLGVATVATAHEERGTLAPYTDEDLRYLRHWFSGLRTNHRKTNNSRVVALALGQASKVRKSSELAAPTCDCKTALSWLPRLTTVESYLSRVTGMNHFNGFSKSVAGITATWLFRKRSVME